MANVIMINFLLILTLLFNIQAYSSNSAVDFLNKYLTTVTSIKAKFSQEVYLLATNALQHRQTGTIYLQIPGKLRVESHHHLLICNHGKIMHHDYEIDSTSYFPVGNLPITSLLMAKAKVEDLFTCENKTLDQIKLIPKQDLAHFDYMELYFKNGQLQGWDIVQGQQFLTKVRLENVVNTTHNDRLFYLIKSNIKRK